jgi:hypothetical protein
VINVYVVALSRYSWNSMIKGMNVCGDMNRVESRCYLFKLRSIMGQLISSEWLVELADCFSRYLLEYRE